MGSAPVITLLLRPYISRKIYLYGARRFIFLGLIASFAGTLLYPYFDSFLPLLILRTVQGSGLILFFFSSITMVSLMIPANRRGELFGIYTTVFIFPLLFSPFLGSYISARFSFLILTKISAAVIIASSFLILFLDNFSQKKRKSDISILPILKKKEILMPLLLIFFIITCDAGLIVFLPIAAGEHNITNFTLYFTVFALSTISIRIFLGKKFDIHPRKNLIIISVFTIAAGILILSRLTFPALIIAGIIYGAGYAVADSNLLPYIFDRLTGSPKEAAVTTYSIAFDSAYLVGPVFLGSIAGKTSYSTLFVFAAGLIIAAGILFIFTTREV
jgi:MFS family permease